MSCSLWVVVFKSTPGMGEMGWPQADANGNHDVFTLPDCSGKEAFEPWGKALCLLISLLPHSYLLMTERIRSSRRWGHSAESYLLRGSISYLRWTGIELARLLFCILYINIWTLSRTICFRPHYWSRTNSEDCISRLIRKIPFTQRVKLKQLWAIGFLILPRRPFCHHILLL